MADSRVERLFCCECSTELRGEPARVIPPLQPGGKGVGGNTRPHVWCHRCLALEVAEVEARPKPHELERDPAFELHRYIWTIGEGRTDEELVRFHRACGWPVTLSALLRRLTEAGKIEKRGDRRVALCSPWSEQPKLTPEESAAEVAKHHRELGAAIPGAKKPPPPRLQRTDRLHIDGVCYEVRKVFSPTELLVELVWGRADVGSMARAEYRCCDRWEITEEFASDADGLPEPLYKEVSCVDCSPPQQVARTREVSRGNVVPSLRACKLDTAEQDADDALPTPEELQADRYVGGVPQVDLQDINDRLKRLERMVEHLVIMDNEKGS